jgi:hypothetical protein
MVDPRWNAAIQENTANVPQSETCTIHFVESQAFIDALASLGIPEPERIFTISLRHYDGGEAVLIRKDSLAETVDFPINPDSVLNLSGQISLTIEGSNCMILKCDRSPMCITGQPSG